MTSWPDRSELLTGRMLTAARRLVLSRPAGLPGVVRLTSSLGIASDLEQVRLLSLPVYLSDFELYIHSSRLHPMNSCHNYSSPLVADVSRSRPSSRVWSTSTTSRSSLITMQAPRISRSRYCSSPPSPPFLSLPGSLLDGLASGRLWGPSLSSAALVPSDPRQAALRPRDRALLQDGGGALRYGIP